MSGVAVPRVVHADAQLVVVDKPTGVPSVPARTPLDPPCVAAVLAAEFGPLEPVHRLDRDTSGLLVLARSAAAREALGRAFELRRVGKRYEARVVGRLPAACGEIHLPLARDPERPPRHRVDPILGRPAVTRWWCLGARGGPTDCVEVEPLTGRSHQIRVHLAWLGAAIAGDPLYLRNPRAAGGRPMAGRLELHAVWLALPHPADGRIVEFHSPRPF